MCFNINVMANVVRGIYVMIFFYIVCRQSAPSSLSPPDNLAVEFQSTIELVNRFDFENADIIIHHSRPGYSSGCNKISVDTLVNYSRTHI